MKKSLFLSLLALMVSTLVWSCLKDQRGIEKSIFELSAFDLVKNKIDASEVNQQIAAKNAAEDRDGGRLNQGCNCKFEITSASPANGFGYWTLGLDYQGTSQPEWFGASQGESHNFYFIATNCFEVEHAGVAPDGGISLTWRVTCNGKSVGHTYTIPGGQSVSSDRIQVCLDQYCQPYLILNE